MENHKIVNWLQGVLQTSSWRNYDDLHITDIDPSFKQKKDEWIQYGLNVLDTANALLSDIQKTEDFFCVLSFSLKGTKNKAGKDFQDLTSLAAKLDNSPPSIYV